MMSSSGAKEQSLQGRTIFFIFSEIMLLYESDDYLHAERYYTNKTQKMLLELDLRSIKTIFMILSYHQGQIFL